MIYLLMFYIKRETVIEKTHTGIKNISLVCQLSYCCLLKTVEVSYAVSFCQRNIFYDYTSTPNTRVIVDFIIFVIYFDQHCSYSGTSEEKE